MTFVILFFSKDIQFVFPEVDKVDYLLITLFCSVCGSPRKLDNLNRCKMACKLTQERPFYEKILRQQIQESRSA